MKPTFRTILTAFREPEKAAGFSADEWLYLYRCCQRRGLGAKLANRLLKALPEEALPPAMQRQLPSSIQLAENNRREMSAEMYYVARVLRTLDTKVVYLKGAAYALQSLTAADGRIFSDIDILVDEEYLEEAEALLQASGWISMKPGDYDDAYYRQWMHEIPPLVHNRRGRVVDLHHTILPRASRLQPVPAEMLRDAQSFKLAEQEVFCFAPADLLIHCAVHAFHDGDLEERLRDVLDIHELVTDFAEDAPFWDSLQRRAALHDAKRPLFYALHYARECFGTSVPSDMLQKGAPGRPNALVLMLMDWMVMRAIMPNVPEHVPLSARLARRVLYMRSHWLRMPPLMLGRHLATKFLMSLGLMRQ